MERYIFLIVAFCVLAGVFCSGSRPVNIGIKDGLLKPCPDSPNCVSSLAKDEEHFIEPLRFGDPVKTAGEAIGKLKTIIMSMKRTKIIEDKDDYIYAEFTSAIFRFVDDVEFKADNDKKIIHVRSASRIGYSDMGVNRKRIEAIRSEFLKK